MVRGKFRKPTKAEELEKKRQELEVKSPSIQLMLAVAVLSSHADYGGRRQPLTKESFEKFFVAARSLALEVIASQKLRVREAILKSFSLSTRGQRKKS